MTPVLFHGPGGREAALRAARLSGRLLGDPIGDSGLKVDDSRQIVLLANSSGIGDAAPCIVVGPLDDATPEAGDALLKTLEDLSEAPLRIFLWASYLGGVIPTIRSRTRHEWCPFSEAGSPFAHLEEDARSLCAAALDGNSSRILSLVRGCGTDTDWAALAQSIMNVLSESMAADGVRSAVLWEALRGLRRKSLSRLALADALLPAGREG